MRILILGLAGTLACSSSESAAPAAAALGYDCAKDVDRTIDCIPELEGASRDKLLERCQTEAGSADLRTRNGRLNKAPCLQKLTCAEFTACVLAVADAERKLNQAERANLKLTELRRAISESRWSEAAAICRVYPDAAADSPSFGAACADVAKGSTEALTKALVGLRDARSDEDTVVRCVELRELSRRLGADQSARASVLCDELATLHLVRQATAAVARAKALGAGDEADTKSAPAPVQVPLQCQWAMEALSKIDSPWARATTQELSTTCNDTLPRALVTALTEALVAMRDGPDALPEARYRELGYSRCFDLRRIAETLGPEAEGGAKALCEEVTLASDVRAAQTEAEQATQAEELPFRCDYTLEKLAKLEGSNWATERAKLLATACYVGVGKRVLAKRVPGMRHACDYQVQKVVSGLQRFGLSDPAVDALRKQAEPLCGGPAPQ